MAIAANSSIISPVSVALTQKLKAIGVSRLKISPHTTKRQRKSVADHTSLQHKDDEDLIKRCKTAWQTLKDALCNDRTLECPGFGRPFIPYKDGSKEKGYGVAVHQIGEDNVERSIMYLSRHLSKAAMSSWPTELETGAAVWALEKLPHYIDHGLITIYTNYVYTSKTFRILDLLKVSVHLGVPTSVSSSQSTLLLPKSSIYQAHSMLTLTPCPACPGRAY